ncbi:hypothetical protein TYRP_000993 [Tyrophagus putrescentiae]|nr:hypothetical protein TYRP_000993 [Tyrophagus putrescentiae]
MSGEWMSEFSTPPPLSELDTPPSPSPPSPSLCNEDNIRRRCEMNYSQKTTPTTDDDNLPAPVSGDHGYKVPSTGTDIHQITTTTSCEGTLNFLISGKEDATTSAPKRQIEDSFLPLKARRMLASEFQAQMTQTYSVPKEHHRIILGKGGAKLSALEQSTGTKIQIPKQDDDSTAVRITGTRETIEKAIHEIQLISNEQKY